MAIISNNQPINPYATSADASVEATGGKKTDVNVAVAGALSTQSTKNFPPPWNYNHNPASLTAFNHFLARVNQLEIDSPAMKVLLTNASTMYIKTIVGADVLHGLNLLGAVSDTFANFPGLERASSRYTAELEKAFRQLERGAISFASFQRKIIAANNKLEASVTRFAMQTFTNLYENDAISNRGIVSLMHLQFQQLAPQVSVGQAVSNIEDRLSNVQSQISNLFDTPNVDIMSLLRQLMTEMDSIRQLANQTKIKERESTLTLQLLGAKETRNKGEEMWKQALIGGIMGIVAGAISIFGSLATVLKATNAEGVARNAMKESLKDSSLSVLAIAKKVDAAGKKAYDAATNVGNGFTSGFSQATKAGGDVGSGYRSTIVADVEAKGKEDEAFAQAASGRADAAAKMAEDLLQSVLKLIEAMMQLSNILNQGVSNTIQKV